MIVDALLRFLYQRYVIMSYTADSVVRVMLIS